VLVGHRDRRVTDERRFRSGYLLVEHTPSDYTSGAGVDGVLASLLGEGIVRGTITRRSGDRRLLGWLPLSDIARVDTKSIILTAVGC